MTEGSKVGFGGAAQDPRPRLTLQTLTRGDGLLGMRACPGFGPRAALLTVAHVQAASGESAASQRDAQLRRVGLAPLPMKQLQWRSPELAASFVNLWSLPEEGHWPDFWAERVPRLQQLGWQIVVLPGFAHQSAVVQRWHLLIHPQTGQELGRELPAVHVPGQSPRVAAAALAADEAAGLPPVFAPAAPELAPLRQHSRMPSWLVSLGIEVDGEKLDLAPLLADLLKRDARWLKLQEIADIDDRLLITLRAAGGRRIEAPAAPLKAIFSAMLDVLANPRRRAAALVLSSWQAQRVENLRLALLAETMAQRAGPHGRWQLQGEAGLSSLAQRLRQAGTPPAVALPTPHEGFMLKLRPYQELGVAWLQYLRQHQLGGILADDMGLGKTAQVLAHLLIEQRAGRLSEPALIVLPTSLIANWQAEAAAVVPGLRTLALHGTARKQAQTHIGQQHIVFTTYPLLWRDLDALRKQHWHSIVLDEAQLVKNAASRAATALRRLSSTHRLCVTGTPLENHLGELWAHFDWLMPGFLGERRSFARDWRRPIEENGEVQRAEALAQRVRPFIMRRRKEVVASELPPRTEIVRRLPLVGRQRSLYESVRVAAEAQVRRLIVDKRLEGEQLAVLDALLKLRQVCCDPQLVKGTALAPTMERAKMELLRQMLPELVAAGHRVLVFSQFTEMLSLLEIELQALALPHLVLTGQTPARDRGSRVRRFQNQDVPLMLLSLKAGGVGLNLTAADTVIHLDPWWNPAVERQASDRAHRMGQRQPVFIYKLVVEGSIEERMLALQARKAALTESVLGSDGGMAVKFSAEDLQGLLAPLA